MVGIDSFDAQLRNSERRLAQADHLIDGMPPAEREARRPLSNQAEAWHTYIERLRALLVVLRSSAQDVRADPLVTCNPVILADEYASGRDVSRKRHRK